MGSTPNLKDRMAQLGFTISYDVRRRRSIADLVQPGERTGIYVLVFENGDLYVGQSVNVVHRFHQHKSRFDDIDRMFFLKVPIGKLDDKEQAVIAEIEHEYRLRNIALASFAPPERDLDMLLSRDWQTSFPSIGNAQDWRSVGRPDDDDLRNRYRRRFDKLMSIDDFSRNGLAVMKKYVDLCLPNPRLTELTFWAVSCLPADPGGDTLTYARFNLYHQEVLTVFGLGDGSEIGFSFHVALNPFDELVFRDLRKRMEQLTSTVFDFHRYKSGGADQWNIVANSTADANDLIDDPVFVRAARDFNLRLMQKGPTRFARYHCLCLSDRLLD